MKELSGLDIIACIRKIPLWIGVPIIIKLVSKISSMLSPGQKLLEETKSFSGVITLAYKIEWHD